MNESYEEVRMDAETLKHIRMVSKYLARFAAELMKRAEVHDQSKLEAPERQIFAEYTPKLKGSTYNSPEYKQLLKEMHVALDHHYENNRHHPEHHQFLAGAPDMMVSYPIAKMNLIDIVEMFADWLAATKRHDNGDIMKSIEINEKRFNVPDQLSDVFHNTVGVLEQ